MPYSKFKLKEVKTELGIKLIENKKLFHQEPAIEISDFLKLALEKYLPLALAINTEKSRSEWIIAPILFELKDQLRDQISLFSGKKLDVDLEKGLDGYCDYIISLNSEQYYISAPILTIIEAKKEDIVAGLGQCIATMYAAQVFNKKEGMNISALYGAVTTGTNWKFIKLENETSWIDIDEYSSKEIEILMGILVSIVNDITHTTVSSLP